MSEKLNLYTVKALYYYKAIEKQNYEKVGGLENFLAIQVEKYNEFGLSGREKKILRLEKEKALLEADLVLNDDRSAITWIEIKKGQLKKFKGSGKQKSTFGTNCAMLRKWGIPIDAAKISLFDFLSNLNLYKSQNAG